MGIQLIGSKTCPFVQRCLIMLYQSKINYRMIAIDLFDKPDWFMKISPTGKVPILEIDGSYIFESLIINEFINDKYKLNLQETQSLQKAVNKSWSEYSSSLILTQYGLVCATDHVKYQSLLNQLNLGLNWLENANINLPYFNGTTLSLVDIAFAPLFFRLNILNEFYGIDFFIDKSKVMTWASNLLTHEAIINSVPSDYKNLIHFNIQNKAGFLTAMDRLITST